jgi:uncharacterized membrane protein
MSDPHLPPPPVPPPPPAPQPAAPLPGAGEDRTLPTVVYVLYLVGLINGLTSVIGFIIALGSRASATPVNETHYRFQIRTGVGVLIGGGLGLALCIVSIPLMLILVGFLVLKLAFLVWGLTAVYLAVRSIVGLVRLSNGEPYPSPDNWLL